MAQRNPQTFAKRAREQAVKEKRERKRAKKAEAAAARQAAAETPSENGGPHTGDEPAPDQPA